MTCMLSKVFPFPHIWSNPNEATQQCQKKKKNAEENDSIYIN